MKEHHPFGVFLPPKTHSMIIGSFPIGKFSHPARSAEIKPHEFKFYFGGETNLLWRLLAGTFKSNIKTVEDIKAMLIKNHLGIGDLIKSCRRKEGGGSDSSLYDIEWNTGLYAQMEASKVKTVYFTSKFVEKNYHRLFPESKIREVLLLSPSGQTYRSLGKNPLYQKFKSLHPELKAYDFMLSSYKEAFQEH